ncbi:uncharacterized protein LOC128257773 [Drosophila gunungcola]|uniref:Uncharacterized protein n=1 Tax=Drosophila gunungcola TaxID=103775 RepID=A0A9P9YS14_9MUSC|nr:uncharacterized protein LOC128257773 [Drosophila gunungcola]KAI8041723.1 hypothetical protein M5D96_005990 [Drosophila gunungcola]
MFYYCCCRQQFVVILVCLLYILLVLAFFVNVFIADRNMHANLMMRNGRHGVHGGGVGVGVPPPAGMHPGHHNPYDMHGYNHYSNYHPQVDPKQQQDMAKKTPQQQAEQDIYYYFNHVFRRRRR